MSPIRAGSDPGHASAARPFAAWFDFKIVETASASRDASGAEPHRLEAMAFWRVREHPACVRNDSRRSLMDDNPTSG
jgi:hypothetical protein